MRCSISMFDISLIRVDDQYKTLLVPTGTIQCNPVQSGTIRYNPVQSSTIRTIQYNPVQSGTIRYNPVQSSTIRAIRYNPVQSGTIRYNPVQSGTIRYNPVQSGTIRCNPVQSGTIRYNPVQSVQSSTAGTTHFTRSCAGSRKVSWVTLYVQHTSSCMCALLPHKRYVHVYAVYIQWLCC